MIGVNRLPIAEFLSRSFRNWSECRIETGIVKRTERGFGISLPCFWSDSWFLLGLRLLHYILMLTLHKRFNWRLVSVYRLLGRLSWWFGLLAFYRTRDCTARSYVSYPCGSCSISVSIYRLFFFQRSENLYLLLLKVPLNGCWREWRT